MQKRLDLPTDDLRAWDWRAALAAHPIGRHFGLAWLAESTGTKRRTVYAYSAGQRTPPITWLRTAAGVLGWEGLSDGTGSDS